MHAVEQDALASGIGVIGELAKRSDDWVLSARNVAHQEGAVAAGQDNTEPRREFASKPRFKVSSSGDGAGPLWYSLNSTMKDRILKRFNDEIAALERELKVDLPKEIQRARELGDLRENAEYKAAKERQEIVNARIAMLKKRVGEISMLNLDRIPHDRAGFGSTVHLRDENGDAIVYQLVMPEESDFDKGLISTSSPIGRAILNKEEGDEILVTTPQGTRSFELVRVITIHDDE
jgi:transcription elongation factor GreA